MSLMWYFSVTFFASVLPYIRYISVFGSSFCLEAPELEIDIVKFLALYMLFQKETISYLSANPCFPGIVHVGHGLGEKKWAFPSFFLYSERGNVLAFLLFYLLVTRFFTNIAYRMKKTFKINIIRSWQIY